MILSDVEVSTDNCIRYIAVHEGRHTQKPLRDWYFSPLFSTQPCTHFEEKKLSHSEWQWKVLGGRRDVPPSSVTLSNTETKEVL